MLIVNPTHRITVEECLIHDYFKVELQYYLIDGDES